MPYGEAEQIMTDKPVLREYIHKKKNSFEHLDRLLEKREAKLKYPGA